MKVAFLILVLGWVASAQPTLFFTPGAGRIGAYQEFGLAACNPGTAAAPISAATVLGEASRAGIMMAGYAALQRAAAAQDELSWQRKALTGLEIAGWAATALMASDLVKIKEKVKAAVPLFTGGLQFATTMIKAPTTKLQDDLFPAAGATLQPGQCGEWTIYGVKR